VILSLLDSVRVQSVFDLVQSVAYDVCDRSKASTGYYGDYGCNCIGDLDRSGIGGGPTLDFLDKGCKQWHNCLRCAKERFGEDCLSDKTSYRLSFSDGEAQCLNRSGTCKRAICECDKHFAESMGESKIIELLQFCAERFLYIVLL